MTPTGQVSSGYNIKIFNMFVDINFCKTPSEKGKILAIKLLRVDMTLACYQLKKLFSLIVTVNCQSLFNFSNIIVKALLSRLAFDIFP